MASVNDTSTVNRSVYRASRGRDERIIAYAIDSLYGSALPTLINLAAAAVVLPAVMWRGVDHVVLMGWAAAMLLVIVGRFLLVRAYRRHRPAAEAARRWAQYFTLTTLLAGIVWGAAGFLFFVPGAIGLQLFLYAWIVGIIAGSIALTSYWPPAYYAYAGPTTLGCSFQMALQGSFEYQVLAVLLLMYFGIVALGVNNQRRAAYDAIALRFENIDLIEQLREQKNIAEQANVAKSKFLAAASHDLRQPLHALGLFVAALKETGTRATRETLTDNINRSLSALEGLFNALLDISKLDAGVVRPEIKDVSLSPLLDRLAVEYEPQARAKGLIWRYEVADVVVRTDIALLETVLRNLIGNAIRYTERGEVALTCAEAGRKVVIEVADTGIGIPAVQHREVFREFVQLHNPERDRAKGLGLGLAIVDRLTKLLDHPLAMRSAPGQGSVFGLELPTGDWAAADAAVQSSIDLAQEEQPLKVLVIEDEVDVREAMVTLLESWGHEAIAVTSEEEALLHTSAAPDAIIADYRLREDRTGTEAILRLRRAWTKPIPALVVTGDTAPERLRQVQQSGFACLHKPVSPGKLRAFLRGLQRERNARGAA